MEHDMENEIEAGGIDTGVIASCDALFLVTSLSIAIEPRVYPKP